MNAEESKSYLVDIPNKLLAARARIDALEGALRNMRYNVDVSTINNSKKSTVKWTELINEAEAVLALPKI